MFFPTSALFSGNKQIMTVMTHHSCFQLTLCMLVILLSFLSSADFFQNQLVPKNLSGIPSKCQIVWTQIMPDICRA